MVKNLFRRQNGLQVKIRFFLERVFRFRPLLLFHQQVFRGILSLFLFNA